MNNLEQFNQITIWILGKLYESFPNPIDFEEVDFEQQTFQNTIDFLHKEGFIRVGVEAGAFGGKRDFHSVVLSMKGLSVLDCIPLSLKEKQTLGQKVQSITKTGVKEVSKEVLKTLVTEIFKSSIGG